MNYSDKPNMVRVDFFKPSGKWYTTEAVEWPNEFYHGLICDCFGMVLEKHLTDVHTGRVRLSEMTAVCLEPYHEHAIPVMAKLPLGNNEMPR